MENFFSNSIKCLHTDIGSEYENDLMLGCLDDDGIEHTTTAPYKPKNNGIAERINHTVMGKVRAMILRCNLGYEFWPYAVLHAEYLHNRTPLSTSESVTPYERLYGRVPSLETLRIFGCLAYAKVPDEKRKKLFEKSIRTALLECLPGMQHKVLDLGNSDIHFVRHVKFDEHRSPLMDQEQENSSLKKKRIATSSQIKTVLRLWTKRILVGRWLWQRWWN
jgi:hypothetical protein